MSIPELKRPHEWHRVGDVIVSFTTAGQIDDDLWNRFVAEGLAAEGIRIAFALTADDSAGISATQRRVAAEVMQAKKIAAIAVTNSRVLRGVLTAVAWLGANTSGYAWENLDAAIEATGANQSQRTELRNLANAFRTKVGA